MGEIPPKTVQVIKLRLVADPPEALDESTATLDVWIRDDGDLAQSIVTKSRSIVVMRERFGATGIHSPYIFHISNVEPVSATCIISQRIDAYIHSSRIFVGLVPGRKNDRYLG